MRLHLLEKSFKSILKACNYFGTIFYELGALTANNLEKLALSPKHLPTWLIWFLKKTFADPLVCTSKCIVCSENLKYLQKLLQDLQAFKIILKLFSGKCERSLRIC